MSSFIGGRVEIDGVGGEATGARGSGRHEVGKEFESRPIDSSHRLADLQVKGQADFEAGGDTSCLGSLFPGGSRTGGSVGMSTSCLLTGTDKPYALETSS
jgi:hypothetical protein